MIRYPRGSARQVSESEVGSGLRARHVRAGDGSVCILAIGRMLEFAEHAAADLAERGVDATVWDVRSCAPLDEEMLADAARHRAVVTIEDGVRDGGVGMTICDRVTALDPQTCVEPMGIPNRFVPHGEPKQILKRLGLDAPAIVDRAERLLATADAAS